MIKERILGKKNSEVPNAHRVQFTSAWHNSEERSFVEKGSHKDGYLPILHSGIQKHTHKCHFISIQVRYLSVFSKNFIKSLITKNQSHTKK